MSERSVERTLALLAAGKCTLIEDRDGMFSLRRGSDRRKRPMLRLKAENVRALEAEGVLARSGSDMTLTQAGAARARRDDAGEGEAYLAQHVALTDRSVMRSSGQAQRVRGVDHDAPLCGDWRV